VTELSTPRLAPIKLRQGGQSLRERAMDRESPLRRLDWVLVASVASLCVLGCALVYAATKPILIDAGLSPTSYLKKDVLNLVIGIGLAVVASLVDYRTLRAYTPVLYVASIVGLLAVLIPHVGVTVNGAHSWINLGGGFEIQPAEFAKIAVILGMAMLLSERREGLDAPTSKDAVLSLAICAPPVLLILAQPDVGSIMVFGFIVFGVLSLSGVSLRWVGGMIIVAIVGVVVIAHLHLLKQYQIDRLTSFARPASSAASQTTGYNANEARIAIGHGGVFGQGLFHGSQVNGGFVPFDYTDFVFSVAGEELGLVGAALLVVLAGIVLWRGLRIARRAEDSFGMLVAVGVVCWFGFQVFENIGMNLGIMPITGLPLPFVSYGGSSMFASMVAVGLLLNVHMRSAR
jgi:rod shape determining protein RodA